MNSIHSKERKKDQEQAFREMKKDVGMTTAQKSNETKWDQSLFCISSQQSLHIRTLLHYNLKLPDVYVGIVGWIYRTKIDPILFRYFFEQWSSLIFYFTKCFSLMCKINHPSNNRVFFNDNTMIIHLVSEEYKEDTRIN